MKKMKIYNKMYEVTTQEDFMKSPNNFPSGIVAVHVQDQVLPFRGAGGVTPGFYATEIASYAIMDDQENSQYSDKNILDFDSCKNYKDLIEMNHSLKSLENEILASNSNLYVPKINEDDTPEMIGLRQAIIEKKIDIDSYQDRFGASFNNDKRILNNANSITFQKLKSVATNLDMDVTLTISDKDGCPNPIGRDIVIPLNYIDEE